MVGVGMCCGWYPNAVGHGRAIIKTRAALGTTLEQARGEVARKGHLTPRCSPQACGRRPAAPCGGFTAPPPGAAIHVHATRELSSCMDGPGKREEVYQTCADLRMVPPPSPLP